MAAMEASQHVYVVKVRTLPDPSLLFPSERRYSALTVAGLAAGHALLGGVALLLGALALSWDPPQGHWVGHLGAGLWLGLAALQASVSGLLAWRRWYEDRYITWFFRSSVLAAVVAGAGLVLTAAALAHLHENLISPTHSHHWAAADVLVDVGGNASGLDTVGGSWLDIADSNSSTISSGGVFADLVRDQDQQHDEDLVAADSTHHESIAGIAGLEPATGDAADSDRELEWSVLRWVPLSPRASAQVRSLVAVNVLVACFLELLWSLLGARVAWRGIKASDSADLAADARPARSARQGGRSRAASAATPTPALEKAPLPHPAPLTALERGAADGKVDVDADAVDGELKGNMAEKKRSTRRAQQSATRRRAPELPPAGLSSELSLSLQQHTMDLEERVARFLDRSQPSPEKEGVVVEEVVPGR